MERQPPLLPEQTGKPARVAGWWRFLTRAVRFVPGRIWRAVSPRLSARSLRSARSRCRTVEELSTLTFSWRGYGTCRSIESLQYHAEQTPFFELVARNPPRFALEIGTCNGGTLFLLMAVAAADARVFSIDLPGGIHGGGYEETQAAFFQRAFPRQQQSLELIRDNSALPATVARVRAALGDNLLDYLFIDGDHRYEAARGDLLRYAPLVRRGGLIAFHDILPNPARPDVEVPRLWAEIKDLAPSVEIVGRSGSPGPDNGGFGVFVDWQPEALAKVANRAVELNT